MYENRIKHLKEMHRVLDDQIFKLERSGVYEDTKLHTMKKQKLELKDEIRRMEKLQWDHDHESLDFDNDR